jgi:hypothetical protein
VLTSIQAFRTLAPQARSTASSHAAEKRPGVRRLPSALATRPARAAQSARQEAPAMRVISGDVREQGVRGGEKISGHVVDAVGGSVGGAWVSVSGGPEPAYSVSNADGSFELNLAPGPGRLQVRAEGYSKLERDVWIPSSEVELVLVPASSIRGRVTTETGEPLAGVVVRAASSDALRAPPELVTSRDDGAYGFEDLAAGTYAISAESAFWRSEERWASLAVGQTLDDLVLEAEPATRLTGSVSALGAPCRDGAVGLTGPLAISVDLEHGELQVDGLLPGTYEVEVRCSGAATRRDQLQVGREPIRREWELDAGLAVEGLVETESGEPVAAVAVLVTPHDPLSDAVSVRCVSDATGRFDCHGLVPGSYDCGLDPAYGSDSDSQRIQLAVDTRPPFVRLRSLATGSIRVGLAAAERADLATLTLRARRAGGRWIEGRVDSDGFHFAGLPLGKYELAFDPPGLDVVDATLARPGESLALELRLPPRGSISGRVVDERGEPIVEAWVIARASGAGLPPLRKSLASTLTDPDGNFTLDRLLRGPYDLEVVAASGSLTLSSVETGRAPLSIALPTHASVTVRATLNGAPLEHFSLAYAQTSSDWTGHMGQAVNGLWAAQSLPPGTYRFAVSSDDAAAVQSFVVAPGSQLELVLALSPAAARATHDAADLLLSDLDTSAGRR